MRLIATQKTSIRKAERLKSNEQRHRDERGADGVQHGVGQRRAADALELEREIGPDDDRDADVAGGVVPRVAHQRVLRMRLSLDGGGLQA